MIANSDRPMRGEHLSRLPVKDLSLYELACVYAYLAQTLPQGEYDPRIFEVVEALESCQHIIDDHAKGVFDQEAFNDGHGCGYDEGYADGFADAEEQATVAKDEL